MYLLERVKVTSVVEEENQEYVVCTKCGSPFRLSCVPVERETFLKKFNEKSAGLFICSKCKTQRARDLNKSFASTNPLPSLDMSFLNRSLMPVPSTHFVDHEVQPKTKASMMKDPDIGAVSRSASIMGSMSSILLEMQNMRKSTYRSDDTSGSLNEMGEEMTDTRIPIEFATSFCHKVETLEKANVAICGRLEQSDANVLSIAKRVDHQDWRFRRNEGTISGLHTLRLRRRIPCSVMPLSCVQFLDYRMSLPMT